MERRWEGERFATCCPVVLPQASLQTIMNRRFAFQCIGLAIGLCLILWATVNFADVGENGSQNVAPPKTAYRDLRRPIRTSSRAYVTLLTSHSKITDLDPYYNATRVLIHSLQRNGHASEPIIVLVAPLVPQARREQFLIDGASEVIEVPYIAPAAQPNARGHRWSDTFTKLNIFNLTQFEVIVYLDCDQFVVGPYDEIWKELDALPKTWQLAAVRDKVWTNIMNAGMVALKPNQATFQALLDRIPQTNTYDTGQYDQGLLNAYFPDGTWPALPSKYNAQFFTDMNTLKDQYSLHDKFWVRENWKNPSVPPLYFNFLASLPIDTVAREAAKTSS